MGSHLRYEADLRSLEMETVANETDGSAVLPSRVPLSSVTTLRTLFQVREEDPGHIEEIARALRAGANVPPLLIFNTGKRLILIDGHHRLEAHRLAGLEDVAIEVFSGSATEAVLQACSANSATKLPMTASQRQDAAWRYVQLQRHSKRDIARATGCSERTVATMRTVLGRLGEEAATTRSWSEAMKQDRASDHTDHTDAEHEEWIEATAQRYADRLARTFGGKLTSNPEIAARALAIHFGRRLPSVVLELRDHMPDQEESDY